MKKLTILIAFIVLFTMSSSLQAQTYTLFDYPGETMTYATDIDDGIIVGFYFNMTTFINSGYTYDGTTFTDLNYPSKPHTRPQGIDGNNIVGYYMGADAIRHGFLFDGSSWTTLDYPAYQTEIFGVDGDNIVGNYIDGSSHYHGCLYNKNTHSWTTIDRPGVLNTKFTGVHGNYLVGNSGDNYSNVNTGFIYNMDLDTWTSVDYKLDHPDTPYYSATSVEGVDATHVVVYWETTGMVYSNYTYEIATGTWTNIDYETTGRQTTNGIDGVNSIIGDIEYAGPGNRGFHLTPAATPPTVTTQAVSGINATYATGNGTITGLGDANPTEHGVCWNTTGTPTTDDDKTTEGSTSSIGAFTSSITGLTVDVTYYVRAYATNSGGTSYGEEVNFTAVASVSQTWTIYLSDTYGDGWNGGSINVLVNSSPVLSSLTCVGGGPEPHTFSVSCDDVITTEYTPGSYGSENSYQIKDHNNIVVAESGQNSQVPQNINYTYVCIVEETPGTVTSQAVSSITTTTATGNGNITSIGTTAITAYGVCWNTSGTPTTGDSSTDEGSAGSTGAYTSNVTGLTHGTTYYVRAYITDGAGTFYGDQVSFETTSIVTTQAATDITGTTATGNGNVVTIGATSITAHGVCWNTSGTPTTGDSFTDEGSAGSTGAFTSDIIGLSSATTYYVRAYITDGTGTFYGNQVNFETVFVSLFPGSGTQGDPYQIADLTDLRNFSENSFYWDKYFIQTADIDASATSSWNSGQGFSPIAFSGSYNGQNHTISGLYINREIYTQAFFKTTNGAVISNLGLVDVDFTCWGNVGAFIGSSSGNTTLNSCFSTGSVSGSYTNAAGLVGYISSGTITINNCYSRVSSYGKGFSGGLIARAQGTIVITNSYNSGSVTGEGTKGGLLAYNYYSTNTISNSFWDTQTTGQSSSFGGGIGKTTAEMKTLSTFTGAGWDFTDTWHKDEYTNNGYPYLIWQGGTFVWTGATNSNWNTSSNWEGNEVPSSLIDNIVIQNVSNDPVISNNGAGTCNNLTINNGAILTVNSGGSLITNGTIINIERTISDAQWHLISIPNNTTIANTFLGDFIQEWNETNMRWDEIVNPATPLLPLTGYSLWATVSKSTYTFTGTPLTGEQTIGMTSAGGGANDGMNLLGNPYPSSIDWNVLDETFGTVYYWDAANNRYATWSGSGSTNEGQQYLPPMQGFFVYTTAAKDFTINNNARTHENAASFYKGGSKEIQHGLRLEALAESGLKSDALLLFRENTQAGFDMQSDAWKIMSGTAGMPELYVKVDNQKLALEARPETETIQLGFANDEAGIYKIDLKEIADIPNAFLEDTKTNTFHNLQSGAYEFTWNPETDLESRFKLHFKAVGIEDNQISESNIRIYAADGQIFIKNGVQTHGRASLHLTITDIMGRTVLQQTISASETTAIPVDLKKGVYVVMVGSGACSTALPLYKTKKVFIK